MPRKTTTVGRFISNKQLFILLILLLSFLNTSIGQKDNKIDSLKILISNQTDSQEKVNNILMLVSKLSNADPLEALFYSHIAYSLSKDINYLSGKVKIRISQSYLYKSTGNLDSAIFCINEYIAISDSLKDSLGLAKGYLQYANLIRRKGETETARDLYRKSLEINKRFDDTGGMISSLNGLGITFKLTTDFDSAAFYYIKTLKLCEEINYDAAIGSVLINLGKVYLELKDYKNAKEYTKKSIEFNKENSNLWNVALAYTNLGMIAVKEEDPEMALDYYNRALELNKRIDSNIGVNNLYLNIGNVYKLDGNFSAALEYYNKALIAFRKIGYKTGIITAMIVAAEVHAKLGRYGIAHSLYDSCLRISWDTGEREKRKDAYMSIYNTYIDAGDYKKAFEYLDKYRLLNDSIYQIEKEESIANLRLKYEKEKDQARILILENENLEKDLDLRTRTNQRNIYMATGSGLFLIVLFFFIFYRHKARKDKIISEQKIKQLEEEKKLLAARSIVEGQEEERKRIAKELHDGLGVLLSTAKMQFTTIKDKSPENRPLIDKATKLLEQATGDVRKISHNMMPGLLTKFGLFEAVEDLFEQLDETEGLNAGVNITGETKRLHENTEIMLYRVIQEMVNNTLKHANAINISINMNIQPEILHIHYSDDGKGFNVEEKMESKSIGMTSIQSRIKFLEGEVTAESKPNKGVSYFIQIPI